MLFGGKVIVIIIKLKNFRIGSFDHHSCAKFKQKFVQLNVKIALFIHFFLFLHRVD